MNLNKLNFLLPDQFAADSMASKLESSLEKMSNLLSSIDLALDDFDENTDGYPTEEEFIETVCENSGLTEESCISLDAGFTTLGEYLHQLHGALVPYWNEQTSSFTEGVLALKDSAGNSVDSTIGESIEYLKTSLVSASCQATALRSMLYNNVSDKISYFTQKASNYIDVASNEFSNIISYYKNQIIQHTSVRDMMSNVSLACDSDGIAAGTTPCIKDTDVSKFTGASPLSAFSLSVVATGAQAVGHAVGTAFKLAFAAVSAIGKWVFKRASSLIETTFTNPYDVKDNGDTTQPSCFKGFQFQGSNQQVTYSFNSDLLEDAFSKSEHIDYVREINEYIQGSIEDRWYKVKVYSGEICFKILSGYIGYNSSDIPKLVVNYDFVFKPYVINPTSCYNYNSNCTIDDEVSYLQSFTDELYLDTNASELDFARGLYSGTKQSMAIFTAIRNSLMASYCSDYTGSTNLAAVNPDNIENSRAITNRDFLVLSSGYHVTDGNTEYSWPVSQLNDQGVLVQTNNFNAGAMACGMILLKIFQDFNPLDVSAETIDALYLPYIVDTEGISDGRFSIKADSENSVIATTLVTVLIVVGVIVAGVGIAKIISKSIAKKRFWKWTQFVGQSDNAMWNGATLSARDRRKYIKYQKKLGMSNVLNSGIVASAKETMNDVSSFMQSPLVTSIIGNDVDPDNNNLSVIKKVITD